MTETTYRNRHYRGHTSLDSYHAGKSYAVFVELSAALGVYPAGTDLESLIAAVNARLEALEAAAIAQVVDFTIDAISKRQQAGSFTIDAYGALSFTIDAYTESGALSFTIDAVIEKLSFTIDAVIGIVYAFTIDARVASHFTVDAVITDGSMVFGSFTADAIVKATSPIVAIHQDDFS